MEEFAPLGANFFPLRFSLILERSGRPGKQTRGNRGVFPFVIKALQELHDAPPLRLNQAK